MPRAVRLVHWLAAAVAACLLGTTLAVAPTYGHHYDVATIARFEVHEFDDAPASTARRYDVREGSVSPSVGARGASTTSSGSVVATNTVDHLVPIGPAPSRAWDVVARVDAKGAPLPGYKGGSVFQNSKGRLPSTNSSGAISYREWDVNPYVKGVDRGAERLVTGSDGSVYFTRDHYESFVMIRGSGAG